jgi:hypothetical protein
MVDERTYTQEEVEELAAALHERQETLEALECARFIMIETKQYPRFIARINYLIASIEGAQKEEVKVIQAPHIPEPEKPEKDENGQTKFKVIKK